MGDGDGWVGGWVALTYRPHVLLDLRAFLRQPLLFAIIPLVGRTLQYVSIRIVEHMRCGHLWIVGKDTQASLMFKRGNYEFRRCSVPSPLHAIGSTFLTVWGGRAISFVCSFLAAFHTPVFALQPMCVPILSPGSARRLPHCSTGHISYGRCDHRAVLRCCHIIPQGNSRMVDSIAGRCSEAAALSHLNSYIPQPM